MRTSGNQRFPIAVHRCSSPANFSFAFSKIPKFENRLSQTKEDISQRDVEVKQAESASDEQRWTAIKERNITVSELLLPLHHRQAG